MRLDRRGFLAAALVPAVVGLPLPLLRPRLIPIIEEGIDWKVIALPGKDESSLNLMRWQV